jgi:hypothetical protein
MRIAASAAQVAQVRSGPRGARTMRDEAEDGATTDGDAFGVMAAV